MFKKYTDNKNQQIVIALLKAHGIKRVVASPGGTNPAFIASLQYDGSFELYSCVDERSAAYMACGICEETGEPVVICCTGATASRNYMPALTEAYYKKLPIITITCSRSLDAIGQLIPQVTDRTCYPNDIFVDGAQLPPVYSKSESDLCAFKVNQILLAAKHRGGGPVHLNVVSLSQSCNTDNLPEVSIIKRYMCYDIMPEIPLGKVAIFIGSHSYMSKREIEAIDKFCATYNAIALCDHTSSYNGVYRVDYSLIGTQTQHTFNLLNIQLLIHIGNVSGDYQTPKCITAKNIWRVSEDGIIRRTFGHVEAVFEMPEYYFFEHYIGKTIMLKNEFSKECNDLYDELYKQIPDLPFSNIWIAKELSPLIPQGSVLHFAILNSLRSWNFFRVNSSIRTMSNVGGFGIDGCTSTLIGASIIRKEIPYFLITGDLAFFYDLNSIGNRHIGSNVRILLINTGNGAEFLHFQSPTYKVGAKSYIAAEGHFGNKSHLLVKSIAESLGFMYISADDKSSFNIYKEIFVTPEIGTKPIIFEVFTDAENQSEAWKLISNLVDASFSDRLKKIGDEIKKSPIAKFVKKVIC